MSKPPQSKTLMRSLGEFFGHVVRGIKTDPGRQPTVVRRESTEQVSADGSYTLRRTVIEEVQVHAPNARPVPPAVEPGSSRADRST
jgi:hypothetical protein